MKLVRLTRVVAALLTTAFVASECQAAVGVPENIILVRNQTTPLPQQFVFGVARTNPNNFNSLAFPNLFFPSAGSGGGAFGNPLKFADVNGDGVDDMISISDARSFSTIANPNDINDPGNVLFDKLQSQAYSIQNPIFDFDFSFGTFVPIQETRVDGNVQFDPMDPTGLVSIAEIITRRDFDGDNLADTAIITDGNFFGSDVLLWNVHGSENDVQMTNLPFNASGDFYNAGEPIFGAPVAQEAIPLVGDFDGDGVLDRAISVNAGLVSGGGINGRLIQVDISAAEETFGDGIPDNGNSNVVGIADDDTVRVADINGDGLDDIVAFRPVMLDDGMGGMVETFELNGYINQGNVSDMGADPIFVEDTAFNTFIGSPDLGDTIEFGLLGVVVALPGDYNSDGLVNAADYAFFRENENQTLTINGEDPAATTPGLFDAEDLAWWAANLGRDDLDSLPSSSIPEPTAGLLALLACVAGTVVRRV